MATALRTSLSEPLFLFTSFVRKLGEDNTQTSLTGRVECGELKSNLQTQLEALATVAQSAAKQALDLTERIGSLRFDISARQHGNTRTHPPNDRRTTDLARRTEQFATLIFNTDRAQPRGDSVDEIIMHKNRQLWDLFDEKEYLRLELDSIRASQLESRDPEMRRANDLLSKENLSLKESKEALQQDLTKTRIEADAWKTLAENVQEMQELAIAAFERCNALERENIELREAMHAFAEGSTSFTVQQMRKIIASLTEEVAQFKKREGSLKEKENMMRDKENNSIIRAMRKQTRELKRRSLLTNKNAEVAVLAPIEPTTNRPTSEYHLPAIPSFSEFFLI